MEKWVEIQKCMCPMPTTLIFFRPISHVCLSTWVDPTRVWVLVFGLVRFYHWPHDEHDIINKFFQFGDQTFGAHGSASPGISISWGQTTGTMHEAESSWEEGDLHWKYPARHAANCSWLIRFKLCVLDVLVGCVGMNG